MKIPNFSGLCPSPPFKDSKYTVICYLPRLWVLVRERAPRDKFQGVRGNIEGVDHRKGGSARKAGGEGNFPCRRSVNFSTSINEVIIKCSMENLVN